MYVLPQFPLTMGIYRMVAPYDFNTKAFAAYSPCQLRFWGADIRPQTGVIFGNAVYPGGTSVLCPPGTDIRDVSCSARADLVEIPSGSGRWYLIADVDDVAKGFPNEYRSANLWKVFGGNGTTLLNFPAWLAPIP